MEAISQTIEVKNHTFSMVLPKSFTAKSVQVIVLPINDNDFEVPQWQQDEVNKRYNQYLQNPEIAINHEDFMAKIDKPKVKMRDLIGSLSNETAKAMLEEVADSRKGWERRLAKQF